MKDKTIIIKQSVQDKLPEGEGFMRLLVWNKKDGDIEIWEDYTPTNMDDRELLISHYSHWSDGEEISLFKLLEEMMPKAEEFKDAFNETHATESYLEYTDAIWVIEWFKSKLTK